MYVSVMVLYLGGKVLHIQCIHYGINASLWNAKEMFSYYYQWEVNCYNMSFLNYILKTYLYFSLTLL